MKYQFKMQHKIESSHRYPHQLRLIPSESTVYCSKCECKINNKDEEVFVFNAIHCLFCAQVR
jgi:hypothetical protein